LTLIEPLLVDIIAEICCLNPCSRGFIGFSGLTKYVKMGWCDSTWGDFDENIEFI